MNSTTSALQHHLDLQRAHVLGALDGLSDAQLRQPVLPSGWNCLGLAGHLDAVRELLDGKQWVVLA